MIKLRTPRGLPVNVPEDLGEDPTVRFSKTQGERIRDYYREHGYVVVEDLVARAHCRTIKELWASEIKP
jgi:hypothetical protein